MQTIHLKEFHPSKLELLSSGTEKPCSPYLPLKKIPPRV